MKKTLVGLVVAIMCAQLASAGVEVTEISYHGWDASYHMTNGTVEVVVVPAIGRIMRYAFVGEESPIWENEAWLGKTRADAEPGEWANFGGDKNWTAPQSDWPKYLERSWPPDFAFDGQPCTAEITEDGSILLTSPVSEDNGLRVLRELKLDIEGTRLQIDQAFEKVEGEPCEVSIWSITQVAEADVLYMPLGEMRDYIPLSKELNPENWRADGAWMHVTRNTQKAAKAGTASKEAWLAWVKGDLAFRIMGSFDPESSYPDGGCNLEIYTNADPLRYSELELLGPINAYSIGDKHSSIMIWELVRLPQRLSAEQRTEMIQPQK